MTLYLPFPEWIAPAVIPGLPFRWYGIFYLAAFAITFFLFLAEIRRRSPSVDRDSVADFFFWVILGLLLGARLFYVLVFDEGDVIRHPWHIVWPFQNGRFTGIQGMSYHGGLIGAVAATVIYSRVRHIDLLVWGDTLAVSAPLGYTLGRIGNFTNGELVGRVTTVPWGVLFPNARRFSVLDPWVLGLADRVGVTVPDGGQMVNLPRHPSQLYEAFLEGLLLWLILWFVFRKRELFRGALIALYIAGYGAARFMAGYYRETDELVGFVISGSGQTSALVAGPFSITVGQVYSLVMIAAGTALAVGFRFLHKPAPIIETFDDDSHTE